MARSIRALLASLALASWPLVALAAPGADSFALGWVRLPGAESCLGPRALAALVERRLGRAVFTTASRADVAIEGRVEPLPAAPGYRAVIRLLDASGAPLGQRELTTSGASCEALDEPVSLVLALLIDPNASLVPLTAGSSSPSVAPLPAASASACPEPPASVRPPTAPAPTAPAPTAPAPTAPAPDAPRPWRWEATVSGALALGAVPAPAPGVLARARVQPAPGWGLAIEAGVWGGTTAGRASAAQVQIGLSEATVLGCPLVVERGRFAVEGCAGVQLGQLSARGQQLSVMRQADRTLVDLAAELRGGVGLAGPLRLTAGATGAVLLRRDTFFYRDASGTRQDLFRPSSLALSVDIGLGLGLP